MSPTRRRTILSAVLLAMLAGTTAWARGRLTEARTAAEGAAAGLAACEDLSDQIRRLQHRPDIAGAGELQIDVLAGKIERAGRSAGMSPAAVVRIWPEQARRVGDSVYKSKSTEIVLERLTLRQLTTFLHTLTVQTPRLWVKSIRLTAPRGQETGRTWGVRVVVSYLIFDPPSRSR